MIGGGVRPQAGFTRLAVRRNGGRQGLCRSRRSRRYGRAKHPRGKGPGVRLGDLEGVQVPSSLSCSPTVPRDPRRRPTPPELASSTDSWTHSALHYHSTITIIVLH